MKQNIKQYKDLPPNAKIHFVGIGGISMCGLAEITHDQGYTVTGSDMHQSEHTDHLLSLGVELVIGQKTENINRFDPDLVVYTAAVPLTNSEIVRSKELGIPTVERGLFLGWLTREFERVINIAGTHGKTTTTAMLAMILLETKQNPTIHLGAKLKAFGESTVHIGDSGKLLVSEACEYHNSFLSSISTTATVLNIDADHLDYFGTLENIIKTFAEFSTQVPESGHLVIPKDGDYIDQMLDHLKELNAKNGRGLPPLVTFGEYLVGADGQYPDLAFKDLTYIDGLPDFDVYWKGEYFCHIHLNVPGEHNIQNALAAIACSMLNGADKDSIERALKNFIGADGRFSIRGEYKGAKVVVDYAHHPKAVEKTLEAATTIPHNNTWVIFQPLTFNRTKLLFDEFVEALLKSTNLMLVEIYSDREQDDLGMSSKLLVEEILARGGQAEFCKTYEEVRDKLEAVVNTGDLILFLGPEDVRSYGARLIKES